MLIQNGFKYLSHPRGSIYYIQAHYYVIHSLLIFAPKISIYIVRFLYLNKYTNQPLQKYSNEFFFHKFIDTWVHTQYTQDLEKKKIPEIIFYENHDRLCCRHKMWWKKRAKRKKLKVNIDVYKNKNKVV